MGTQRGSLEVEGLAKLTRDLQAAGADLDDIKDAFAQIAAQGAALAASYAPELTGALKADIRGNRAKNKAVIIAGRARLKYAGPINYGWPARNIEAAAFMQKADEELEPVALQQLEDALNRIIIRRDLK